MSDQKGPKTFSFEIIRAESIKPEERVKNGLPESGLIVKEKIAHSYPEVKFHIVKNGIADFLRKIESKEL